MVRIFQPRKSISLLKKFALLTLSALFICQSVTFATPVKQVKSTNPIDFYQISVTKQEKLMYQGKNFKVTFIGETIRNNNSIMAFRVTGTKDKIGFLWKAIFSDGSMIDQGNLYIAEIREYANETVYIVQTPKVKGKKLVRLDYSVDQKTDTNTRIIYHTINLNLKETQKVVIPAVYGVKDYKVSPQWKNTNKDSTVNIKSLSLKKISEDEYYFDFGGSIVFNSDKNTEGNYTITNGSYLFGGGSIYSTNYNKGSKQFYANIGQEFKASGVFIHKGFVDGPDSIVTLSLLDHTYTFDLKTGKIANSNSDYLYTTEVDTNFARYINPTVDIFGNAFMNPIEVASHGSLYFLNKRYSSLTFNVAIEEGIIFGPPFSDGYIALYSTDNVGVEASQNPDDLPKENLIQVIKIEKNTDIPTFTVPVKDVEKLTILGDHHLMLISATLK